MRNLIKKRYRLRINDQKQKNIEFKLEGVVIEVVRKMS